MNDNVKPEDLLSHYSVTFTNNQDRKLPYCHAIINLNGQKLHSQNDSFPYCFVSIFPTVNGYLQDHLMTMILKLLTNKFLKYMITIATTKNRYATVIKIKVLIVALTY